MNLNLFLVQLILMVDVWLRQKLHLKQHKQFMIIGSKKYIQKISRDTKGSVSEWKRQLQ